MCWATAGLLLLASMVVLCAALVLPVFFSDGNRLLVGWGVCDELGVGAGCSQAFA